MKCIDALLNEYGISELIITCESRELERFTNNNRLLNESTSDLSIHHYPMEIGHPHPIKEMMEIIQLLIQSLESGAKIGIM